MLTNNALSRVFNKGNIPLETIDSDSNIFIIGEAVKGPSMNIVYANNAQDIVQIFGQNSSLTNAYLEATNRGAKNIYLIKTNGQHRIIKIKDYITFYSIESNEAYNDISITFHNDGLDLFMNIEWPLINSIKTYLISGLTFEQLAKSINDDATIGLVKDTRNDGSITYSQVPFVAESNSNIEIFSSMINELIINEVQVADENKDIESTLDILAFLQSYPVREIAFLNIEFDDTVKKYKTIIDIEDLDNQLFKIELDDSDGIKEEQIISIGEINATVRYINGDFIIIEGNLNNIDSLIDSNIECGQELIYNILSDFCTTKSLMLEPCIAIIGHSQEIDSDTLVIRSANFIKKLSDIKISEYVVIPLMSNKVVGVYNTTDENDVLYYKSNGVALISALIQNISDYENFSNQKLDDYIYIDFYAMNKSKATQLNKLGFLTGYMQNESYYLTQGYNLLKYSRDCGDGNITYQSLSPLLMNLSNIKLLQDFLYGINEIYNLIGIMSDPQPAIKKIINAKADAMYPYIQKIDLNISKELIDGSYTVYVIITIYPLGEIQSLTIKVGIL